LSQKYCNLAILASVIVDNVRDAFLTRIVAFHLLLSGFPTFNSVTPTVGNKYFVAKLLA